MSSLSIFKETSRVQIPLTYSIKLCFNSSTQLLDGYKPDMERWQMYRYNAILSNIGVRLNLINHFVGFISCQFACNSTLRNPIFRWESCKGIVWESVKKMLKIVHWSRDLRLDLTGGSRLASHQRMHTSEACREAEPSCQL